jgi:hypothetical protein
MSVIKLDKEQQISLYVVSGFLSDVDKNLALLGYYAAQSGNFLPTYRPNISAPSSTVKILILENGTDRFSQNVGKKLPLCAE